MVTCSRFLGASLLFSLSLFVSPKTIADDKAATVSLQDYLKQGRESGLNLIYSSSLVRPGDRIVADPTASFSLEVLQTQLLERGIELQLLRPGSYLLRRTEIVAEVEEAKEPAVGVVLEEVVVHSSRYHWSRRTHDSARFDSEELNSRPVPANDTLRVVNQLPGSASVGLSARPHVRGGRENETLIELDTVRLYRPFHFSSYNSLYSVFDHRVFQELEFFSGAYPLSFGDSLSATMSLHPADLEQVENRQELGVGLYQYSYFHSLQRARDAITFSIRRSTPEAGQFLEAPDLGHPAYGDIFLRYQRDTDSGYRWSTNALWYVDDLEMGNPALEEAEIHERSGYVWGRLQSPGEGNWSWQGTVGFGYIDSERKGELAQPNRVIGRLDHGMHLQTAFASQDIRWADDRSEFMFGWDFRHLRADYDVYSEQVIGPAFDDLGNIDRPIIDRFEDQQNADYGALYAGWKRRLRSDLYLDLGARVDAQHFSGRRDMEPAYRVALLYSPTPNVDLRLTRGRHSQSQSLDDLAVVDGQRLPGPPQVGDQSILALNWFLPGWGIELRGEWYRKDVSAVAVYYDNLSNAFTLLPELQPDRVQLSPNHYRAEGAEVSLSMPLGPVTLWANYATSEARDRFDGAEVARSWDQSRTLNAGLATEVAGWSLSLAVTEHEGWLSTPLSLEGEVVVAGERNSRRFDHFVSVDAKAVHEWQLPNSRLRLELGLTNLLDRANVIAVNYTLDEDNSDLLATPFNSLRRTAFFDLYWSF